MKKPCLGLPLALAAGLAVAVIIVQCTAWAPFNLEYRGEPLFLEGGRIQSLRDFTVSTFESRRYFDLLNMVASCGKPFPANRFLEAAAPDPGGAGSRGFGHGKLISMLQELGVAEDELKYRREDGWPSPDLLRFIGSGSYVFPFPDAYRLPLIDLKAEVDLKTIFPELDLSVRGAFSAKSLEKAVLADLVLLGPDFPALPNLSLGMLARARQEARRVDQANARYLQGLLIVLIICLILSALLVFLINREGRLATLAKAVSTLIILGALVLLWLTPSFNRTRRIEFDFKKLTAADLTELKREATLTLEVLLQKDALKTDRLPIDRIKQLIEAPPIEPAP